jgi:serine protease Do
MNTKFLSLRPWLVSGLMALGVTTAGLTAYHYGVQKPVHIYQLSSQNGVPASRAVFTTGPDGQPVPLDFTGVAQQVMDAVVHVRVTQLRGNQAPDEAIPEPFRDFFRQDPFFGPQFRFRQQPDGGPVPQFGQGSGVIINADGFIVTNNHVVGEADDVEVTLHDGRSYKAEVVGSDPSTDLALLRIQEKNLPFLAFANSNDVRVGEWVLAVGNPFNLNSTVTAGIVSAKGRSINMLRDRFAVESFIQTDAAINPGNSGGALVNLNGGLIGINTAIASPTGTYSGYGFAVPSNIAQKIVQDLIQYGVVQRGVLGITIRTLDGALAREKDLPLTRGVYVDSLLENSAAAAAGLRRGDVITGIGDQPTTSVARLQEIVAGHRPGDQLKVQVKRGNEDKTFTVTLQNRQGKTGLVDRNEPQVIGDRLGAELETLDDKTARKLDLPGGVRVKVISAGKLRKQTQMREGFIITRVDGKAVRSVEDLEKALKDKKGGVMLEGVYEDLPGTHYYAFGM